MTTARPLALALTALTNLVACGGTPAATPGADASLSPDVRLAADVVPVGGDAGSPLATLCANARRLGCANAATCEQEAAMLFGDVPARCQARIDDLLACAVQRSASTCFTGPPAQCNAENEALSRCAMADDAGAPPDTSEPEDAGPPACPEVSGRYTAMTAAGFPAVCPLGVITLARASGAACRYTVSFQNDSTETFALSAATLDLDRNRTVTGEATVMTAMGTRRIALAGRVGAVPGDRLLRQTEPEGVFICEWGLSPKP